MSQSGLAKQILIFPGSGPTRERAGSIPAEASLVEQILSGDQSAFDRLYKKYSPMVHGIVLARAPRRETDDLVQEIFLTVFRKLDTLDDPSALGAWIASIARRCVVDHYRGTKPFEEITGDIDGGSAPFDEAFEVLAAIRSLPDAYSETLILRLVEGMTGPEIAEQTGLTHDSVRVNLHRGMKMLRKKLGVGGI